jgi:outer membrane biogenesis lipoprotein LolB
MKLILAGLAAAVLAGCAVNDPRPYKEGPFGVQIRDSRQQVDEENQRMRD